MLTYQERWKAPPHHLRHARGQRADVVHSLLGLLGRVGCGHLHCRRHVPHATREHAVRRRYSGYLFYWYKSTNTDATGASELYSRDVSLASLSFEYAFQTSGDVRPGAYAAVARRFLLLSLLVLLVQNYKY